ncbi:MAG: M17 family peptidase N-terminal domain-containing protein, partial [Haloechinothrix sp.]
MTVPKFVLTDNTEESLAKSGAEAIVVGTVKADNAQGEDAFELAEGATAVDAAFGGELLDLLSAMGATGKAEEVVKVPTLGKVPAAVVVAVGLGKAGEDGITPEQVRRASGVVARGLAGKKRALTTLSAIDLQAAVEGTALGAYAFTEYKSDPGDAPVAVVDLAGPANGTTKEHRATVKAACAIAEAVITARDLVNTPP